MKNQESNCAIRYGFNLKKPTWRYAIVGIYDLFLPLYKMGWGRGITCGPGKTTALHASLELCLL